MPSPHTNTSGDHNLPMGSEDPLSPKSLRSPSRKSSVSSMSAAPSQHFALATGMANPFAAPMPGFKALRAKSPSNPRTSLDRRVLQPRRRATTGEDVQKDVRAGSISESSMTTIQTTTRKPNTSQVELLYPIGYRPEVLDRHALYFCLHSIELIFIYSPTFQRCYGPRISYNGQRVVFRRLPEGQTAHALPGPGLRSTYILYVIPLLPIALASRLLYPAYKQTGGKLEVLWQRVEKGLLIKGIPHSMGVKSCRGMEGVSVFRVH